MELLPAWQRIIAETKAPIPPQAISRYVPKNPAFFSSSVNFVDSKIAAGSMLQLAQERPIVRIGFDTEFRYSRPGVGVGNGHVAYDPRSMEPLLLSLTMIENQPDARCEAFRFVVDLRRGDVLDAVRSICGLPTLFVGHYSHVECLCLRQLGIQPPTRLWDTWVAEKVFHLGLGNPHYKRQPGTDEVDQARAKEDADAEMSLRLDLLSTCRRYGVAHGMETDKERLQQSFLNHAAEAPFTKEQINYSAADADAAAMLYPWQVLVAAKNGTLDHLITIEMPWVRVNADITFRGVRIDAAKRDRVQVSLDGKLKEAEAGLRRMGLDNFQSHFQLINFFQGRGFAELFRQGNGYSFDKDHLKEYRDRDPAIKLLFEARRVQCLKSDKILWPELVGADGRVHPDHRHLGADSGRQTSRRPNVLGLDRTMRPLVVPDDGQAIGEVDLCQIEPGIAGAIYNDPQLVKMFNDGDVYCEMAKAFFPSELTEEDLKLGSSEFKRKHVKRRDLMKTCTLGIIYGLTAFGLAPRLRCSIVEATGFLDRFMAMFPDLSKALRECVDYGARRGFATSSTGLRRYRVNVGEPSCWERNWLKNHPVQATAACLFKAACIRLQKLYQEHDAWIIVPFHDAVVFECPADRLEVVAKLTQQVMCQTVQEYFPQLRPRAELNISHSECWNKEGQHQALENWLSPPRCVAE